MGKWYVPDRRWVAIGIKEREDYTRHYVLEGIFHANVPNDVIKSYETAEYLMALAWYHYPLYDEALKKVLGVLEMAIKLKCKQAGIELEFINNKGKKETHRLASLIDKVCALEKEKDIRDQLHLARELRNYFAHPDSYSFSGGFFKLPFIPIINVLNLLFLDVKIVSEGKNRLGQLIKQYGSIRNGLFGLEREGENILITQSEPLHVFQKEGLWYVCWCFLPLQSNVQESVTPPILLTLSYTDGSSATLLGKDIKLKSDVSVIHVPKALAQIMLPEQEKAWRNLSEERRQSYDFFIRSEKAKQLGLIQYQYCWN